MLAPAWFEKELKKLDPALVVYWNPALRMWDLFRLYGKSGNLSERMPKSEIVFVGKLGNQALYRHRPYGAFLGSLKPPLGLDQIRYLRSCDNWDRDVHKKAMELPDIQQASRERDGRNFDEAMVKDIASGFRWTNTPKVGV